MTNSDGRVRDLNDLQFFAAVVLHGGFSAASRALGLPKSRLSKRVAALEARLGVRLLERSTRRFNVTHIGHDVFAHAQSLLAEADAIDRIASNAVAEPHGLVRVGCPMGVQYALSAALPGFLERYPRMRVQLLVTNRRIDLIEERVDVAIRVREQLDSDADLQLKVIAHSRSVTVASPHFLDRWGRPHTPADLAEMPTLAQTEHMGPVAWALHGSDGVVETVTHTPRLSSLDFAVLRRAAVDHAGVALLPSLECRAATENGELERILPEWSSADGIIHLVFTSRQGLLPGVRAFIDFAAATLKGSVS